MIVLFEVSPPFRWRAKREKAGPMTRWIWGWFSVAYFHRCGLNDLDDVFRRDERERMLAEGYVKA